MRKSEFDKIAISKFIELSYEKQNEVLEDHFSFDRLVKKFEEYGSIPKQCIGPVLARVEFIGQCYYEIDPNTDDHEDYDNNEGDDE